MPQETKPKPKRSTLFKVALGSALLGNTLDMYTTEKALQNRNLRELNPVMRNSKVRIPLKVGTSAAQVGLLDKLYEKHPKLATGLGLGLGGAFTAIAYNNYRNSRKYR